MQTATARFTLTFGDIAAMTSIMMVVAGLLWFVIKLSLGKAVADMALELVKSENRVIEKVALKFAEKSITDLEMKSVKEKLEDLEHQVANNTQEK